MKPQTLRPKTARSITRQIRTRLALLRRRIRNSWRDENYLAWTMYVPDRPPSRDPGPKP